MATTEIGSVLLALCAEDPPPRDAPELKDLELIRLANRHGVLPLVTGPEYATKRALVFTAELIHVLDVLSQAGIPVVPLRGPVIGHLLYGDAAAREFSDLDILVRKQDFARVVQALQSPKPPRQECSLRWGTEISLQRTPHAPSVDVHWELGPGYYPFALPPDRIWSDLRTVSFERRPTPFPSPECLLIALCIHGAKHHWERLMWLCDVARLVSKPGLEWDAAASIAAASRCRRPLILGLYLAHELLGAEVPDAMLEQARRSTSMQALARQVRERMFADDSRPYTALESCSFHFRLAGFRGGLRYAMGVLLVPTDADWNWVVLPRELGWLYYPLRLIRFAWKYASAPLKQF
jgi:hypothetical protein